MNRMEPYPPNTKRWEVGDLVIHRGDDKHRSMLMCVTGYCKDGRIKTVYIHRLDRRGRPKDISVMMKVWDNPLEALLDPADFAIEVPA